MSEKFTLSQEDLTKYSIEEEVPLPKAPDVSTKDTGVIRDIQTGLDSLQLALDKRAKEFNVVAPQLEHPVLPKEFTSDHYKALQEVFHLDKLEPLVLPKPYEITEEYMAMMYPVVQSELDESNGLVSHRPDHWNEIADQFLVGGRGDLKWGDVYVPSFQREAEIFQGLLLLTESITRPCHLFNGHKLYGSENGDDGALDPLLPLIKEIFGDHANRFNLPLNRIISELIPKVKEKIVNAFTAKGLSAPIFEVIVTPALANNLQTTLKHPENSISNTVEWTSSSLLVHNGSGHAQHMVVGYSDLGGAAYVSSATGHSVDGINGFRLSIAPGCGRVY